MGKSIQLSLGVPRQIKQRQRRRMHGNSTLWFGEHKGKTVDTLLVENPVYLEWCHLNLKGLLFDKFTRKRITKAIKALSAKPASLLDMENQTISMKQE